MSRFWATCFGSSEDQASPHRSRRRRHHDSETDTSYDSDDESDSDDADGRFNRVERGEIRTGGGFRREQDIRLEEVMTTDEDLRRPLKNDIRGNISVVDNGSQLGPTPVVSRFVEHVLRESQKGYIQRPQQAENKSSNSRDVLPQVSLLHEVSKSMPDSSPAFFQQLKGRLEERLSSGGSISSSGSSGGESGRSSTSSGLGDSFTSGNDTGGSGAAGGKIQQRRNILQMADGSRGKSHAPYKSKGDWSRGILQDVVVEEEEAVASAAANGLGHMSHFMAGRRGGERSSVATVEGIHLPSGAREWGASKMLSSELPGRTSLKIGKSFNRNRISHHPNAVRVEDHPMSNGTNNINRSMSHENTVGSLKGNTNQFSYFSTIPKNSRNDMVTRQAILKY